MASSRSATFNADLKQDQSVSTKGVLYTCHVCKVSKAAMKRCAVCHSRIYCGKECQKKDWKDGHKVACAAEKKRASKDVHGFCEAHGTFDVCHNFYQDKLLRQENWERALDEFDGNLLLALDRITKQDAARYKLANKDGKKVETKEKEGKNWHVPGEDGKLTSYTRSEIMQLFPDGM